MSVSRETMRTVLQEHVDAENVHDRERVLATYATKDPVFEDVPAGRRYVGPEEIVDNYRHLWDGFPGLVRRIDRWTFGDDTCVIELTLSGAHEGPYRNIDATGRSIEFRIIAHFAFDDDGRITQETAYYDALTFQRQLGLTSRRTDASRA
jgi:steroid delta-isomerase-like uncharacterized protein